MTEPPQRRGSGVVAGAVLLALIVGWAPAAAGQIEDKRAEAAAIAAKLDYQAREIVARDKEHRRARDALDIADAAVARAEEELALSVRRQDDARRLMAVHAQVAYVGGGSVSFIGRMARASFDDAASRRAYLQVAAGEDRLAIERLRAAQEDLRARQQSLGRARETAADRAKVTGADKVRLEQAMSAQRALLTRANGEVAVLVAAEQAKRDAESARLVAAAARTTTTVAVVAAAPAAPRSPAPATPAPSPAPAGSADATFACIRQLESGNNYSSPGGGAYQFQDATWQSLGYKGRAQDAPPAVQDEAARKLQARDGWGPWTTAPLCGRV